MTKKLLYCSVLLLTLLGCVTSCSSTDEYQKAPLPADDNIGAYFPITNQSAVLRGEDDEKSFTVHLRRTSTKDSIVVPIHVLSQTDNIKVPTSVTFDKGEETTYITITYTDLTTTPKCELEIDEAYCNPYTRKDGSSRASFNVYKLNLISSNIEVTPYNSSTTDLFSGVSGQAIYQLGQDNRFVWRNYLGSGIDLEFKLDGTFDAEDITNCKGSVIPLTHYQNDDYGWYLMDDEEGTDSENYTAWKPEGCKTEGVTDYMYFYYVYQGGSYFYIDFARLGDTDSQYSGGWISSAVVDTSKNYHSFYIYIKYY